jgi:hypothetical protein
MIWDFLWGAAEEFDNGIGTEVKLIGTSQIDNSGERNDASHT